MKRIPTSPLPQIARVAIRVSLVGDRGEGSDSGRELLSPDVQLDAARAYCQMHGLTLDVEASQAHQDLDQGAFRKDWRKRPGLMAHLKAAQEGRINHILFYKLSRMARNALDGLEIFEAFEAAGCTVHVIKEGIDTGTAVGRLVRTMLLAVAEMQGEDMADFARDSIQKRAREGKHHGSLPAWVVRTATGELEIVSTIAAAYTRMIALRLEGASYTKIAATLNREGYRKPNTSLWKNSDCASALSHDNRLRLTGHSILGRGLEEGDPKRIVTPGVFPPVMDEETATSLELLQRRYEQENTNRLARWTNSRSATTRWILSGLVRCPHCGGRLYSLTGGNGGDRRYYHCPQSRALPEDHPGAKTYLVNAQMLEEATLRTLRLALEHAPPLQNVVKPAKPSVEGQRQALTRQIDSLFELHARGVLVAEDFERRYTELAERRANLSQELDEQSSHIARGLAQAIADEVSPSQESLRQLILLLVARVECPDSGERAARRAEGRIDAANREPRREAVIWFQEGLFPWPFAHADLRTLAFKGARRVSFGTNQP